MEFLPENVYHVFNQGNNREVIFRQEEDYLIFLRLLRKLILPQCDLLAYCLMPNHFHLMIHTDERVAEFAKQGGLFLDPVTNGLRKLLSGYARIFNKKYNRTGSLFRQKTKSKLLTDESIVVNATASVEDNCGNCFIYVHQNPWKAGLVVMLEDWAYSSFRDFAGLRNGTLCNKEMAGKYCSFDLVEFRNLCGQEIKINFDTDFLR